MVRVTIKVEVGTAGLEPATYGCEPQCSVRLSYAHFNSFYGTLVPYRGRSGGSPHLLGSVLIAFRQLMVYQPS